MPPNAPAILISPLAKPVVAEELQIRVVGLERGVMDVKFGALEEEEGVMVHEFIAAV